MPLGPNVTSPDPSARWKVVDVSLELLLAVAPAIILVLYAGSRVYRVRHGMSARTSGRKWLLIFVGFVFVLPIVLDVLTGSGGALGQLHPVSSMFLYLGWLLLFTILMGIAALFVLWLAPPMVRPTLLLALIGREPNSRGIPFDPPITPALSEALANVEALNASFPRGRAFTNQLARPDFATTWADLDAATGKLELLIGTAMELGIGVAQQAVDVAADARSRLETLRREAETHGQTVAV